MPATWTAPRTWATADFGNEVLLNTHLRDNLEWLKTPAAVSSEGVSDISTTSTTAVEMTGMSGELLITDSRLIVGYSGAMRADADTRQLIMVVNVNFLSTGIASVWTQIGVNVRMASFLVRVTGIAAGLRHVAVTWKTSAGTMFQDGATCQRRFFAAEWL